MNLKYGVIIFIITYIIDKIVIMFLESKNFIEKSTSSIFSISSLIEFFVWVIIFTLVYMIFLKLKRFL